MVRTLLVDSLEFKGCKRSGNKTTRSLDCGQSQRNIDNKAVKSYLKVLETERLVLRWLGPDDAAFIRQLVNEPAWLRYIGDKGIRTIEDARNYIENSPVAMLPSDSASAYIWLS